MQPIFNPTTDNNPNQASNNQKRVIFIAGYRRSGTTALQDQIADHSDVHYFSGIERNEFHLFDLIERDPEAYARLVLGHGVSPTFDFEMDAETIFDRCPRPVGLVKSTRLLMCDANWTRFTSWARRTHHEVAVVSIVRFPLDAISSDITRDSPELPPERRVQPLIPDERVSLPQTAQEVWCEAYTRALNITDFTSRARLIRLEDFVASPSTACDDLSHWLGLESPLLPKQWEARHWGRWQSDRCFRGFRPSSRLIEIARRFDYRIPAARLAG